jgi:hypothetical protein
LGSFEWRSLVAICNPDKVDTKQYVKADNDWVDLNHNLKKQINSNFVLLSGAST